jgi:hypothetical protein
MWVGVGRFVKKLFWAFLERMSRQKIGWNEDTRHKHGSAVLTEIETKISGMPTRRAAARGNLLDYKMILINRYHNDTLHRYGASTLAQRWEGTWFESKSGHPLSELRIFMILLTASSKIMVYNLTWISAASFQILSSSSSYP